MISLLFKGCQGYKKEFAGHKLNKVVCYDEDKAMKLLRDMPDAFELVKRECGDKIPKPRKEKEMPKPENKMMGEPEGKKEEATETDESIPDSNAPEEDPKEKKEEPKRLKRLKKQ